MRRRERQGTVQSLFSVFVLLRDLEGLLHSRTGLQLGKSEAAGVANDADDDGIGSGRLAKVEVEVGEVLFEIL